MIIGLLSLVSFCFAQNTVVKHYGVNKGLPSSETYFVTQDSKGYLWIATDAGVVKYDGYKFITYTTNEGMPDNTIFKIHEDKYGRVWFSTYSGKFAYYEHKRDTIIQIKANSTLSRLIKTFPIDFVFDSKDTLFASLDKKGIVKIFPPYYDSVVFNKYSIDCVYLKEIENSVFLYGKNFLKDVPNVDRIPIIYDDKNDWELKRTDTSTKVTRFGSHTSFAFNNKHKFISTGFAVYEHLNQKFLKKFDLSDIGNEDVNIITMNVDGVDRLWVNILSSGTKLLNFENVKDNPIEFFNNLTVTCSFRDNHNGIWFTTLEDGVYYIPTLDFKFYNTKDGFSAEKLHALTLWNHNLLCIASNETFNHFDLKSKNIQRYTFNDNSMWNIKTLGRVYAVSGSPSAVFNSNDKRFDLIFTFENNNKKYLRLKDLEDYNDDFFLGSEEGILYKINKNTGEAIILTTNLPMIFSICKSNDNIYLGTKTGLYKFKNGKAIYLGDYNPKLKYRIDDIIAAADNELVLATKGYGVLILKNDSIQYQFTERDGLASNITKHFALDGLKNIWVGTNKGISRLKKNQKGTYDLNTINMSEGIVSSEINQLIVVDSVLYFATNKGLGEIKVKDAFNEGYKIPVYIESLIIDNVKYNIDSIQKISYDKNIIQILYKGVDVKSEGDILYKYRLIGLENDWTYSKNIFVQYTTLPPGKYQFVVYALNSNGEASVKPASIIFIVSTPFWKQWWFIVILIILVGVIAYYVITKRVKSIQKKEEEKTRFNKLIADSELKALRAQMNPHFIFNAINSIQSFVLKNDSKSAQKYLTKFARLIRSVLENSKYELVLLSKEIQALELYIELESLRASFSFDYEIILEDSMHADHYYIPPMIIQPYVENAILHGLTPLKERRGKLTLIFSQKGNILNCIIEDNGIGREAAQAIKQRKDLGRESMGMAVTQSRIEMLNLQSSLYTKVSVIDKYSNGEACGTTVEVNIEIKKI